jgi:hypothetical protein
LLKVGKNKFFTSYSKSKCLWKTITMTRNKRKNTFQNKGLFL